VHKTLHFVLENSKKNISEGLNRPTLNGKGTPLRLLDPRDLFEIPSTLTLEPAGARDEYHVHVSGPNYVI